MGTDVIITLKKIRRESSNGERNSIQNRLYVSDLVKEYLQSPTKSSLKTTELYDKIVEKMADHILNRGYSDIDIDINDIKDLECFLSKQGTKSKISYEQDYKGEERKISKWEFNNE